MTSKNLFFKLIWQDFKKRIWCPILIFLAYFLGMEMRLLNYLDRFKRYPSNYDYTVRHYLANEFFSPAQNYTVTYLTMIVGVVCALSGYAYLHSRKQLDTYHSMPVKREKLFFARYVSGFLMFLLPVIVHSCICLLLGAAKDAFSGHGVVNAVGYFGVQILCFLLLYSITIVAVCLTGNMIISILGCCVLAGYSSIVTFLREILYDNFFHTYLSSYKEQVWAFSPIGMILRLHEYAEEYHKANSGFSYRCLISYSAVILLAVLVFTILGVWLYKKRATEAAGRPIAFGITEPFIKTIVVIPSSIFCGLFISEIIDYNSFGWLVFGIIFGFLVVSLVMEIIFRLDIKCAFRHWKQVVFNGACLILIVVIFKYDVLGYNTYVPTEKELNSCAVSVSGLMNINMEERNGRYGYYKHINAMDYRFEHMNVLDNPSVMDLARKAASENLQYVQFDYYEGIEASPEYQEIQKREDNYREIAFQYTKMNGKKVYRQYVIDISDEETLNLLAEIFADSDYKLGAFPILTNGWKKEYSQVNCESNDFSGTVKLSPERQSKLLEVYQSELLDLTLDEVMNEMPLGNLIFQIKENEKYSSYEEGYKIYPSFVATIGLLKEYGFDFNEELTVEQAKEIRVSRYCEDAVLFENMKDEAVAAQKTYSNEAVIEYTDEESKAAILDSAINRELLNGISYYFDIDESEEDVTVYYEMDGVEESRYYCFSKENKPDFIDADIADRIEDMRQELMEE